MKYNIIRARTDVVGSEVLCENLDEDMALSMLVYYKQNAEGKHLHGRDGKLVPYLSVMRWFMLPAAA